MESANVAARAGGLNRGETDPHEVESKALQ